MRFPFYRLQWRDFRYIFHSIYFNFHYLPFKQAVYLPILLYKPHLLRCKGTIKLIPDDGKIHLGMIRLGFRKVSIYPDNGVTWEQLGGTVYFRGRCTIGNDSYLSFGNNTTVDFGDDFINQAGAKIVSYRGIRFGKETRLGWGVVCMDTNFHPLFDMEKKVFKRASGPITIGDNNWFGMECRIMHSVVTPERCIFGMGSIVTRGSEKESYCLMGGSPVKVLSRNVMRIIGQDTEDY